MAKSAGEWVTLVSKPAFGLNVGDLKLRFVKGEPQKVTNPAALKRLRECESVQFKFMKKKPAIRKPRKGGAIKTSDVKKGADE